MNYEEISDFEINKLMAVNLGSMKNEKHPNSGILQSLKNSVCTEFGVKDYCNNPADMWPIIERERITVTPYEDKTQGWFSTTDTSFFVDDKNPLRAAAIVFFNDERCGECKLNQINELGIKNIIQFHTKVELIAEHGNDGITLSIGCESVGIEPKLFVTARGHVRKFKTIGAIRSMLSRVGLDDHKLIIKA